MKKDVIKLVSVILASTFILSGLVFFFVSDYKEEKRIRIATEDKYYASINKAYDGFKENSTLISKSLEDFSNYIIEYTEFYVEMPKKYNDAVDKVEFYTKELIKLESNTKYLMDNCFEQEHTNNLATKNCHSYLISFEKIVNVFMNRIDFLNDKINEYNEWVDEEDNNFEKLEKIKIERYTNYVDYNKDGIYLGSDKG